MDLENENIPTTVQNLTWDEQIDLLTLTCELAALKSNEFIPCCESKQVIEKIVNLVISIEDRLISRDLLSKQDRYTIPKSTFQQED